MSSTTTPDTIANNDAELPNADLNETRFIEFFAGDGGLTQAVKAAGVPVDEPQDLATGGVDFSKEDELNGVRNYLHELHVNGTKLILHFAPPCATFSRARDRSWRTRLRSTARPQGLPGCGAACRTANLVARNTLDLIEWSVKTLKATVSMENPESSYMWPFLDFDPDLPFDDVVFSPCMFGSNIRKPTRVRCWNWNPVGLAKKCVLKNGVFTCGRTRDDPRVALEFGSRSTASAAAYEEGVCQAWAAEVAKTARTIHTDSGAVKTANVTSDGRVYRHLWRGTDHMGTKELRDMEDVDSMGGMRNPHDLEAKWPSLWNTMADIRRLLLQMRYHFPELQGLLACCGKEPPRGPPGDDILDKVRRVLAIYLDIPLLDALYTHPASPWKAGLVRAIQEKTSDPDRALSRWLREGAPMGISKVVDPSNLLPVVNEHPEITVENLDALERKKDNHKSYYDVVDGARPPAWDLIEEQVNSGAAHLFESQEHAERFLGGLTHPAPLGCVSKQSDAGIWKHRLIQDQTANSVNRAVLLPERQVLPRGVDHARDLAVLAEQCLPGEGVETMVLDFKDAFMSIPLDKSERRFNCARAGFEVNRKRDAKYQNEPAKGTFVVWQVLGFGGRPNPLIFSRAAGFAARCAQAVLGPEAREARDPLAQMVGYGRLQLYVDDPTLVVRGTPEQRATAFDVVILLWMALGIPLSWKKGERYDNDVPHRWIGIEYQLSGAGALMRLPPAYIKDLLEKIEPLCQSTGTILVQDLEVLIGKVARVAHVVPLAKPFVACLWAALAASRRLSDSGHREAPRHHLPRRRFAHAAAWIRALLREDGGCNLPLERLVTPKPPTDSPASGWHVEFDASIYGGGAILKDGNGIITHYFNVVWCGDEAAHLDIQPHDSKHQTFWEFATLLLCLLTWSDWFVNETVTLLGDNIGALNLALSLKGRGHLLAVSREIAWRRARRRWNFVVGHLPSENNSVADALSRANDPAGVPWPSEALGGADFSKPPRLADVWLARPA